MRFDTVIRNATVATTTHGLRVISPSFALHLSLFVLFGSPSFAQKSPSASELPEMLMTEQGFLAINTPKGWVRSDGPGLAYFIPSAGSKGQPRVWIYISSAPIGPKEEAKDLKSYIESDIAGFKQRFKAGLAREEAAISLPNAKLQAPVYVFQSSEKHNSIEQVVYIGEINRVLTLVLSARDKSSFEKALPVFREFAQSYRGSITPTPDPN